MSFKLNATHAPTSVERLFSMTPLQGLHDVLHQWDHYWVHGRGLIDVDRHVM
jgi:hypothetical protein